MITLLRALAAVLLLSVSAVALPGTVLAAEPTFGTPTASASLGQPLTVTSEIDGVEGGTVDLLLGLVGQAGLAGEEPQIVVPALCLNGTRDALCRRDLMEAVLPRLRPTFRMHWLEGADHSWHVLKSSGRTDPEVLEEAGLAAERWLSAT